MIESDMTVQLTISDTHNSKESEGKYSNINVDSAFVGGVTDFSDRDYKINITISGNDHPKENRKIFDVDGNPLGKTASEILMHEVVVHAVPYITKYHQQNGIALENEVNEELGLPLRSEKNSKGFFHRTFNYEYINKEQICEN